MLDLLLCALSLALPQASSGPSVNDLLNSLANPAEREQASTELVRRGQASESEKSRISEGLAEKINHLENRDLWRAEVKLAGDLRLSVLAPLIAQSLDQDTRSFPGGIYTMNKGASPEYDPAVKTLIAFGPAAVPAIRNELDHGNRGARFRCVRALSFIPGSEALEALNQQDAKEQDPALKGLIEMYLDNPREGSTGPLRITKPPRSK